MSTPGLFSPDLLPKSTFDVGLEAAAWFDEQLVLLGVVEAEEPPLFLHPYKPMCGQRGRPTAFSPVAALARPLTRVVDSVADGLHSPLPTQRPSSLPSRKC